MSEKVENNVVEDVEGTVEPVTDTTAEEEKKPGKAKKVLKWALGALAAVAVAVTAVVIGHKAHGNDDGDSAETGTEE